MKRRVFFQSAPLELATSLATTLAAVLLLALFARPLWAAGPPPLPGQALGAAQADPPARVGRLAYAAGGVDFYNERLNTWAQAPLNTPITSRTALWADAYGRAEARVGSSVIRLDASTHANFVLLDDTHTVIEVARGSVSLRVRSINPGEIVELRTEGSVLQITQPGYYRVDYAPQNRTMAARVVQGAAVLNFGRERFSLQSGQQVAVDLHTQLITAQREAEISDFERWAGERDRGWGRMNSLRYVSAETTGVEALESHGAWVNDANYGAVWYPRSVTSGWAPFRHGHWEWVNPWGWTWIDQAPWGFATSHYGRWVFLSGSWGWVPGAIVTRPVWAPALVGFYGRGGGVSLSIGTAPVVGWFPLGPGEYWRPAYWHTPAYVRNVNYTHVTNITNVTVVNNNGTPAANGALPDIRNPISGGAGGSANYRYAQTAFAATAVPAASFGSGRSANAVSVPVQPAQLASVSVAGTGVMPVEAPANPGRFTRAPQAVAAQGGVQSGVLPSVQTGIQPSVPAGTPSAVQGPVQSVRSAPTAVPAPSSVNPGPLVNPPAASATPAWPRARPPLAGGHPAAAIAGSGAAGVSPSAAPYAAPAPAQFGPQSGATGRIAVPYAPTPQSAPISPLPGAEPTPAVTVGPSMEQRRRIRAMQAESGVMPGAAHAAPPAKGPRRQELDEKEGRGRAQREGLQEHAEQDRKGRMRER